MPTFKNHAPGSPQEAIETFNRALHMEEVKREILQDFNKLREAQQAQLAMANNRLINPSWVLPPGAVSDELARQRGDQIRAYLDGEIKKRLGEGQGQLLQARASMTVAIERAVPAALAEIDELLQPSYEALVSVAVHFQQPTPVEAAKRYFIARFVERICQLARTEMLRATDQHARSCGCMIFEGGETFLCKEHSLSLDRLRAAEAS